MPNPLRCLIAFGANLGDPQESLRHSIQRLGEHGLELVSNSGLYRTIAVGGPPNQPDFLNAAVLTETNLAPDVIVAVLLQIEQELGRKRDRRWSARTVDLDLLLVDDLVLAAPDAVVPHPRMTWRKFVLQPASEIAPEMIHPLSGLTVLQLCNRLDQLPREIAWLNREPDDTLLTNVAVAIGNRGRLLPAREQQVNSGIELAETGVDCWKVLVGRSRTEIMESANSSRLLVWDSRHWGSADVESRWARHFPGAVMDLGLADLAAAVEIPAAMDAM